MTRKILAAFISLALMASGAFAAVTPQQALSDPRIAPYIETTKQNGTALLPGRYILTTEIERDDGEGKILAPTDWILNIGQPDQNHVYPIYISYHDGDGALDMTFDTDEPVPVMRTYFRDDDDEYELWAEDFAVVLSDGSKHLWCLGSVETGEISYMYPLNDVWFPEGWYLGTWENESGNSVSFTDDGQFMINGQSFGKFTVSDNRGI